MAISGKAVFVGGAVLLAGIVALLSGSGSAKAAGGGGKPPPPPPPDGTKKGCSPPTSKPQDIVLGRDMTPEQIAKMIVGRTPSASDPLDLEFMRANAPASGPGWTYVYQIIAKDPDTGATRVAGTKKIDHQASAGETASWTAPYQATDPFATYSVAWIEVLVSSGTTVHLPTTWNQYLTWDGAKYASTGDGKTYPPCT